MTNYYSDGKEVCLGDRVVLWPGAEGVIVALIGAGEFSEEYPEQYWAYLEQGVLVYSPQAGLIHYIEMEPATSLIERQAKTSDQGKHEA